MYNSKLYFSSALWKYNCCLFKKDLPSEVNESTTWSSRNHQVLHLSEHTVTEQPYYSLTGNRHYKGCQDNQPWFRATDRPPPWARSTSHETEQMLCQSANHRWARGKRWHHRQIRATAATVLFVVSACSWTQRLSAFTSGIKDTRRCLVH